MSTLDRIQYLYGLYMENSLWSLFLTSTAIHAILLVASPLQAVFKWYRRKSSDSDTPLPYIFTVVGSGLWLRYYMFIEDIKLILLQTYAITMQLFYLCALLYYRTRPRRLAQIMFILLLLQILLYLYIEVLNDNDGRTLTGRFASGIQIASSFICPFMIYRAVKTKVIDFIPFALVAFTWLMELHAIVYSIFINDFYMLLANTTFCIMDGSLLCMFFVYPTRKETSNPIQQYQ